MSFTVRSGTAAVPVVQRVREGVGVDELQSVVAGGNSEKNGDPAASGWIAERTSCTNPGSVQLCQQAPPPNVSARSTTVPSGPARSAVIAAARPFGPDHDDGRRQASPRGQVRSVLARRNAAAGPRRARSDGGIVFSSISASTGWSGHGPWWISARFNRPCPPHRATRSVRKCAQQARIGVDGLAAPGGSRRRSAARSPPRRRLSYSSRPGASSARISARTCRACRHAAPPRLRDRSRHRG